MANTAGPVARSNWLLWPTPQAQVARSNWLLWPTPQHEVGVPDRIARRLTFPERVTDLNLKRLRKAVINGQNTWPGANFVRPRNQPGSSRPIALMYANRKLVVRH